MKQMKLRICLAVASVALLGSLESATAQGNLVVNGGFDTDASGWTVVNVGSGGGYVSESGIPGGYFYISGPPSTPPPSISQTINGLIPGTSYIVTGDYSLGKGSPAEAGFGVAVDGTCLFVGGSTSAWQSFSFDYTADAPSALLSLSSDVLGSWDSYGVDNIAVTAVPEPSSLYLVGIGGIAGLRWLRRKGSAC